ncbi:RHD3/Sey1 [Amanita rubescens]|nr:RHD3/Sey1 [Amanita rubescens]
MPAQTAVLPPGDSSTTNGHARGYLDRIQIIDDEKNFTSKLNAQLEQWDLRDVGFGYNIVAVFGSQSTGKSTLLNRLFGTTFDVMDETKRQQTTKGIWMCRAKDSNILVMDVEGTDGRERGEDQDFERKSALFSLASSEILIVNLWEHQVGLYQGANMGLLKTVFEVNLGLFGKRAIEGTSGRTLLLFVIRDHLGVTPLKNLQDTVTSDLEKIWRSLSKPPELRECLLTDFFDLAFTALPHKILVPDKFESEVAKLRTKFVNKGQEGYFFKPMYHKRVPADGVAFYMESNWEQVQSNKDLDLPTQQELLAQFRCDEISKVALLDFNEQAKSQKKPIESGRVVQGLGGMMRAWHTEALSQYDRDASRYHQQVYKRKRSDLIATMNSTLTPLFLGQLKNLHKSCLVAFKKQMMDGMKGDSYNFAEIVSKARRNTEGSFSSGAKEALLEETDWSWEDELELLRDEVRQVADQCRKDETKKMINSIERKFKARITEPVELALDKATPDMWDKVLRAFKDALAETEAQYMSKAISFNCTDDENATSLAELRRRTWQALRAKIDEQLAETVILGKLRAHFEERFRYDETGVPRVWKPKDDIKGVFKVAKDETLELVLLYAKIVPKESVNKYELPADASGVGSIEEYDFASSLVIFTETKVRDLQSKFGRDADAHYVEAERSMVMGIAQIPRWVYALLVVLGWNEAMAILLNPLLFTFAIVAIVTLYFITQLGLAGPLYNMVSMVFSEIWDHLVTLLKQQLAEPAPARTRESPPRTDSRDDVRQELRRRQT